MKKFMLLVVCIFSIYNTYAGPILPPDNCGVDSTDTFLYWSDSSKLEIWRAKTNGTELKKISPNPYKITAVDVDLNNGFIYYANTEFASESSTLFRSDLNGKKRTIIASGFNIYQIQLNMANNHLYFSERNLGKLNRINLDGSNLVNLLDIDYIARFEVSTNQGIIYYSDINTTFSINLDGSNVQLLSSSFGQAADYTIDETNNNLFVSTSSNPGTIRCDLNAQNCVNNILGITQQTIIYNNKFIALESSQITQYELDGTNPIVLKENIKISSEDYIDPINQHLYEVNENLTRVSWNNESILNLIGFYNEPHGLAIDNQKQKIYFSEIDNGGVKFSNNQNINPYDTLQIYKNLSFGNNTRGIILDPYNRYIYYADMIGSSSTDMELRRVSLDDNNQFDILNTNQINLHDVALDLVRNKIYWTHDIDTGPALISRSNLDGSDVELIHTSSDNGIRGIDIDSTNNIIYWTDHKLKEISYMNMNDASPTAATFAALTDKPHHLFVNELDNRIYWSTGTGSSPSTLSGKIQSTSLLNPPPVAALDITDNITNLPQTIRDITLSLECDHNVTSPSYSLGGSLNSLANAEIVTLQNNSRSLLSLDSNSDFEFSSFVSETNSYEVTVAVQPNTQTCIVTGGNSGNNNGTGTMGNAPDTSILVDCNSQPTTVSDIYFSNEDTFHIGDDVDVNNADSNDDGVLVNDTDLDMDILSVANPGTYTATGLGGSIFINNDGSFFYTPIPDSFGVDTFAFEVTDGIQTVPSSLSITVNPVNDPPSFDVIGDVSYNSLTVGNQNIQIDNFAFNFIFGPDNESSQTVSSFLVNIDSDSNSVLTSASMTIDGHLQLEFSLNFGSAMIEITMFDDGGDNNGGVNSFSQVIEVSYLDLIFSNGFN
jgi:hypothetical protein